MIETVHHLVEWAALVIEALAVLVIIIGVVKVLLTRETICYAFQLGPRGAYETYKHQLGRPLLLGLDLLLAGDVVKTVAVELTLHNVAALGLLAIVRTFLGWSLTVELEHRWPWQDRKDS
jgi:uncharacterized membrane protein